MYTAPVELSDRSSDVFGHKGLSDELSAGVCDDA